MICKSCGHDNARIWYEPVIPRVSASASPRGDDIPVREKVCKRWACAACGRYHFEDGSLYANPFEDQV